MTKTNNSEPLRSRVDRRNLFLLVLHVGFLVVSLWVHPIVHSPADRALPYAATEGVGFADAAVANAYGQGVALND